VFVYLETWEAPVRPDLYQGIVGMELNHTVSVTFVPDISRHVPPWDERLLPDDVDRVQTVDEARVATAMLAGYLVTPHPALAGTTDRFTVPPAEGHEEMGPSTTLVWYVSPHEFDRYADELHRLTGIVGNRHSGITVSQLQEYDVVRFVDREIVGSRLLTPYEAEMLGR